MMQSEYSRAPATVDGPFGGWDGPFGHCTPGGAGQPAPRPAGRTSRLARMCPLGGRRGYLRRRGRDRAARGRRVAQDARSSHPTRGDTLGPGRQGDHSSPAADSCPLGDTSREVGRASKPVGIAGRTNRRTRAMNGPHTGPGPGGQPSRAAHQPAGALRVAVARRLPTGRSRGHRAWCGTHHRDPGPDVDPAAGKVDPSADAPGLAAAVGVLLAPHITRADGRLHQHATRPGPDLGGPRQRTEVRDAQVGAAGRRRSAAPLRRSRSASPGSWSRWTPRGASDRAASRP